ncbi:hypothetical protein CR513_60753, partial [Mucuna pruriens]
MQPTDTCPPHTVHSRLFRPSPPHKRVLGMSLRYMSRVIYQGGMRMVQGMKEQGSKCDSSSIKSLRDSASSKQARLLPALKSANNDNLKQAEHSLRTVMTL